MEKRETEKRNMENKNIENQNVESETAEDQTEEKRENQNAEDQTENQAAENPEDETAVSGENEQTEKKHNQKLRLGLTSSLAVVLVLIVAIVGNLLVEKLQISWDLSQEGVYTISDQTKSILKGLEQDITVYVLDSEEGFPIGYAQILQQYTKNSSHIQIAYRELSLYPNFAYDYIDSATTINKDSIIVVCGDKHVYLDSDEYTSVGAGDNGTYQTSLNFEPLLTSAINSVNDGESSVIYQTTGHNELEFSSSIQTAILRDNYTLKDLSLLNLDAVPEDADILLINSPTSDFSKEDCDKVKSYIENGGKVYFIMEATIVLGNLENLMETYGIRAEEGIVMEQDNSRIYGDTPTYMIPVINDTEITKKQYEANLALLVPVAKGLTEKTGTGRTITGLLSTSNYAFSKVNLDSEYLSREDSDITGPFYLAALSEKEGSGSLIVLASSNMCTDQVDEVVSGNNVDFLLNGFNYLIGDTDKMSIRSKDIQYDVSVYTTAQTRIISAVAEWGIPVLILAVGIVLVLRRKRHSKPLTTEG